MIILLTSGFWLLKSWIFYHAMSQNACEVFSFNVNRSLPIQSRTLRNPLHWFYLLYLNQNFLTCYTSNLISSWIIPHHQNIIWNGQDPEKLTKGMQDKSSIYWLFLMEFPSYCRYILFLDVRIGRNFSVLWFMQTATDKTCSSLYNTYLKKMWIDYFFLLLPENTSISFGIISHVCVVRICCNK